MVDRDEEEVAGPQLPLLTITGLWLFPRYLHMLGKINLSAAFGPISLRVLQFVAVTFVPVWIFLAVFETPWSGPSLFLRVTLPLLIVWWGLKVAANGGKPLEMGWSAVRYWAAVAGQVLGARLRPSAARPRGAVRVRVARPNQVPVDQPAVLPPAVSSYAVFEQHEELREEEPASA